MGKVMTKDKGIALLTRIVETLSRSADYCSVSLVYEQAATLLAEDRTWIIYIDGWSIDGEEDWQEYQIEHAVYETLKKDLALPNPKPIYPGVELNKETQIALTVIAYIDAFYWEVIYRRPIAVDEQEQALKALSVDVEAIRQLAKIVSRV